MNMKTTTTRPGVLDVLAMLKLDPHYQDRGDMLADAHTLHTMGSTKGAEALRKYAYEMYPLPAALARAGGDA